MITRIHNADDALTAYNENLEGVLVGKRKIPLAKEVSNILGKACSEARAKLMYRMWLGDKTPMQWYEEQAQTKLIENNLAKKTKALKTNGKRKAGRNIKAA